MKLTKAIEEADTYYMETGEHAHVVKVDGTFEWFCHSYFDNGTDREMVVVYNTWNG